MESHQDLGNEQVAGQVMDSLGEPQESEEGLHEGSDKTSDPLYVQKRLKQQRRQHEKEIRELHARINELQSSPSNNDQPNPYMSNTHEVDDQIRKAVGYALQQKDMAERKAREADQAAHVQRQRSELHRHLDKVAEKYDDFDDVVRADDAPFTEHMANGALLLPRTGAGSAGEVLYKLGKNRDELSRISKLHPLDQASELVKLSHAMVNGNGAESKSSNNAILGHVKTNPVNSKNQINDRTPVSELRQMMKTNAKAWS